MLFQLIYFHIIPLDIAIQNEHYPTAKLLCDFIKIWFTENDSVNNNLNCHAKESNNPSIKSYHDQAMTHHIQNKDQFDEENDS